MPQRKGENKEEQNTETPKKPSKRIQPLCLIGPQSKSNRTKDQNETRKDQLERHNMLRRNIVAEKTEINEHNLKNILSGSSEDICFIVQELMRLNREEISLEKIKDILLFSNKIFYRRLVLVVTNDGNVCIRCLCIKEKCPVCIQFHKKEEKMYISNGLHINRKYELDVINSPIRIRKINHHQISTDTDFNSMEYIYKNRVIINEKNENK